MFLLSAQSPGHGQLGRSSGGSSQSSGRVLGAGEPGLGAVRPLVLHEAVVDVALGAPVLQISSLHGTLPPQRVIKLIVVVSLVVQKVGLTVALAGTPPTAASSVQELLTASSSHPRPLSWLSEVFPRPSLSHLLVSAVVARAVSQSLREEGWVVICYQTLHFRLYHDALMPCFPCRLQPPGLTKSVLRFTKKLHH